MTNFNPKTIELAPGDGRLNTRIVTEQQLPRKMEIAVIGRLYFWYRGGLFHIFNTDKSVTVDIEVGEPYPTIDGVTSYVSYTRKLFDDNEMGAPDALSSNRTPYLSNQFPDDQWDDLTWELSQIMQMYLGEWPELVTYNRKADTHNKRRSIIIKATEHKRKHERLTSEAEYLTRYMEHL